MEGLTTFSWNTFFVLILIMLALWFFTVQTRIGRKLVSQITPWSIPQWSRLLLVLSITFFILVDPIFHLLTFGIFIILYYVFVNRNLLNTNIQKLGVNNEVLSGTLAFAGFDSSKLELICRSKNERNLVKEKRAINKCLFSFPYIDNKDFPKVNYLEEEYHVSLDLSSEKFTSSLMEHLAKAGFEVKLKNN